MKPAPGSIPQSGTRAGVARARSGAPPAMATDSSTVGGERAATPFAGD